MSRIVVDAVRAGQFRLESSDCVSRIGIKQLVTRNVLLSGELLADQFPRDS